MLLIVLANVSLFFFDFKLILAKEAPESFRKIKAETGLFNAKFGYIHPNSCVSEPIQPARP